MMFFWRLAKLSSRKTKFVVLASLVDYLERLSGNTKKLSSPVLFDPVTCLPPLLS